MSTSLDQKFTADASQVEAVFEKMKRHNQDLLTQIQKLKQEQKQGHDQANRGEQERGSWLKSSLTDVTKLAAGYFTVQAAVGVVSRAYETWINRMEKAATQAKSLNEIILDAALATGNIQNANKIQAFAQNAASQGLAPAPVAGQVFATVGKNMHLDATLGQQTAMSGEFLKYLPMMADDERDRLAATAGKIHKLYKGEKSPGEVMDTLLAARQRAGGRWEETKDRDFWKGVYGAQATGAETPDQAVAWGVTAMQNEAEAGFLERRPDALRKVIHVTPRDQLYKLKGWERERAKLLNKLAPMGPAERDAFLNENDAAARAFYDADYDNFKQTQQGLPESRALMAQAAAPGSYADVLYKQAMTQRASQEKRAELRTQSRSSSVLAEHEITALARERTMKFVDDMATKHDPGGLLPDAMFTGSAGMKFDWYSRLESRFKEVPIEKQIQRTQKAVAGMSWIPESEREQFFKQEQQVLNAQGQATRQAAREDVFLKIENTLDSILNIGKAMMSQVPNTKTTPANPIDVRARGESR